MPALRSLRLRYSPIDVPAGVMVMRAIGCFGSNAQRGRDVAADMDARMRRHDAGLRATRPKPSNARRCALSSRLLRRAGVERKRLDHVFGRGQVRRRPQRPAPPKPSLVCPSMNTPGDLGVRRRDRDLDAAAAAAAPRAGRPRRPRNPCRRRTPRCRAPIPGCPPRPFGARRGWPACRVPRGARRAGAPRRRTRTALGRRPCPRTR